MRSAYRTGKCHLRFRAVRRFHSAFRSEPGLAVTQVILVAPGRGYVLTFSTTPARATVDALVFDEIGRSIVLAP